MNFFDLIIIIPLIWGGFKGYKKGLIIELASLVALGLGIWGGLKFSSLTASYLGGVFNISEQLMPLISFAITFILIVVAVFALAKLLQKVVKMVALSLVNRIAGIAFGALKFALIISVILTIFDGVNSKIEMVTPEMKESSLLYHPISILAPTIIPGFKEVNMENIVDAPIDVEVKVKTPLNDTGEED